jgi:hypothetical protein
MPPGKAKTTPKAKARPKSKLKKNADGVVLLSGGNPQIAKGEGDGPVQAYIAGCRAGSAISAKGSTR